MYYVVKWFRVDLNGSGPPNLGRADVFSHPTQGTNLPGGVRMVLVSGNVCQSAVTTAPGVDIVCWHAPEQVESTDGTVRWGGTMGGVEEAI